MSGIWPAFWTSSANWPFDGEIDVYEGVHESTNNQVAWHTDKGEMAVTREIRCADQQLMN